MRWCPFNSLWLLPNERLKPPVLRVFELSILYDCFPEVPEDWAFLCDIKLSILYDCFSTTLDQGAINPADSLSILYDCFYWRWLEEHRRCHSLSILYDCFVKKLRPEPSDSGDVIFQFFMIASQRLLQQPPLRELLLSILYDCFGSTTLTRRAWSPCSPFNSLWLLLYEYMRLTYYKTELSILYDCFWAEWMSLLEPGLKTFNSLWLLRSSVYPLGWV